MAGNLFLYVPSTFGISNFYHLLDTPSHCENVTRPRFPILLNCNLVVKAHQSLDKILEHLSCQKQRKDQYATLYPASRHSKRRIFQKKCASRLIFIQMSPFPKIKHSWMLKHWDLLACEEKNNSSLLANASMNQGSQWTVPLQSRCNTLCEKDTNTHNPYARDLNAFRTKVANLDAILMNKDTINQENNQEYNDNSRARNEHASAFDKWYDPAFHEFSFSNFNSFSRTHDIDQATINEVNESVNLTSAYDFTSETFIPNVEPRVKLPSPIGEKYKHAILWRDETEIEAMIDLNICESMNPPNLQTSDGSVNMTWSDISPHEKVDETSYLPFESEDHLDEIDALIENSYERTPLQRLAEDATQSNFYVCDQCKHYFHTSKLHSIHLFECHSNFFNSHFNQSFECLVCDEVFPSPVERAFHLCMIHGIQGSQATHSLLQGFPIQYETE